jgi:apolipoprotein N-acyltransferase
VAFPFLWVGVEYFRTLSQFAFPWSDLGYSQAYYLYLAQIVSIIGVHGLSLFVAAVNVLLVQAVRKGRLFEQRLTPTLISAAVVILLISYGWIMVPKYPLPGETRVAVLQGSVPLGEKWSPDSEASIIDLYDSLAQSVQDTIKPELYVWPETIVPCYPKHEYACGSRLGSLARSTGAYHLIGALGSRIIDHEQRHFNSCYQFSPTGAIERQYDKIKLVPFSEQVPYQKTLGFLRRDVLSEYLTFINSSGVQWWSDFHPGDSIVVFDLPEARYGVLICFESTFSEYAGDMIRRGAGFLVTITNDTWFGTSVGIHMHERIFVMRVIENRCWGVRAANSGISIIVDDYGRIRKRLGPWEIGTIVESVGSHSAGSVYTATGDIAGLVSLLLLSAAAAILAVKWSIRRFLSAKSSQV